MSAQGRPITLLLIALVAAACTTAGSSPTPARTSTPTTTAPLTAVPPTPEPTRTPLATPGPGEVAGLVVRFTWCDDVCVANPGTTILADGRVIWMSEGPAGMVLSERTLTPSGLQIVRDAIDATGLFEADGSYWPTVKPGKVPPAHGAIGYGFRATHGDALVIVGATDPAIFEGDNRIWGDVWDIPAELYVLADLARKLSDPVAWLPDDAWANVRRPHVAEAYLLIVTGERFAGDRPPYPDVDAVRWPFPFSIDAIGAPYTAQGRIVGNSRCLPITRELAAELAAAERAVGYERSIADPYTELSYAWARGPGSVNVTVRLLLPDQPATCVDGGTW